MRDGWNKDKVSQHVKESFSTDQFRPYTFGLFRRYYVNMVKVVQISNSLSTFYYQYNMKTVSLD